MEAEVVPAQMGNEVMKHATNARRLLLSLLQYRRPFPEWTWAEQREGRKAKSEGTPRDPCDP